MVKRLSIMGGLALAGLAAVMPAGIASAQNVNDKTLVVFGNDRCPTGTICVRKGESERYRIPKELRESTPSANNETWASRQQTLSGVGASGAGSCSNTGAGGWTGCWSQQMRDAKADKKQAKAEADATP